MLSCKDICTKASESLDRKLPLSERLSVKMHLFMCKYCRRVVRQMELLRVVSQRYLSATEDRPEQAALSEEASARILKRLRSADSGQHGDE